MTSLFVTIVAIVLFGIISLLSLTYIDVDHAKATTQAPVVALSLGNMIETISVYRNANNLAPTSLTELNNFIESPALPNIPGARWIVNASGFCLVLPGTPFNRELLDVTSSKISLSGISGIVSTVACGGTAHAGEHSIRIII